MNLLDLAPLLDPVQIIPIRNAPEHQQLVVVDAKPFHRQPTLRIYRTSDTLVASRVRDHWRVGNYDYFPGDLRFFK